LKRKAARPDTIARLKIRLNGPLKGRGSSRLEYKSKNNVDNYSQSL
jgi:hypothetical protein